MSDDLFYFTLLIASAWCIITSLWMLDYLLCKYWPWGRKMEDKSDDPRYWIGKYLDKFDWRKGQRLRVMALEKEHLDRLKFFFADFIVDSLLQRQVNGDMDASEVSKELDRLGNLFDMPDLLPRNLQALKETIRQRLQNRDAYKPVPFPDSKPKDFFNKAKINPDPLQRRQTKWLTSLRSWLRTKASRRQMPSS